MTQYAELVAAGVADERALVLVDRRGDRALITLSEPERLNRLSAGMMFQLQGGSTSWYAIRACVR